MRECRGSEETDGAIGFAEIDHKPAVLVFMLAQ